MKFEVGMEDVYLNKIEDDINKYSVFYREYLLSYIKYFKRNPYEFITFVLNLAKKLDSEYRDGETDDDINFYLSEYPEHIKQIKDDFLNYGFHAESDLEIYALWSEYSDYLFASWLSPMYNPFTDCLCYLFNAFYKHEEKRNIPIEYYLGRRSFLEQKDFESKN